MKNKRSKKYFTVLEMLIAMGLLSVIMFSLLSMLDQSQKAMSKGMSRLNVTDEARIVLDQIENDITCIDYKNALLKDAHNVSHPQDDVLKKTARGFSIYTTRPGRLPLLCKISYEKEGYKLVVKTKTYDEKKKSWVTPENEDENGRILLTNVLAFNVHIEKYQNLGDENKYPQKVTVEIQLIDDDTRKLGYSGPEDSQNKPINEEKIIKKIGEDAFKARAARFSRVVSLEPPESM